MEARHRPVILALLALAAAPVAHAEEPETAPGTDGAPPPYEALLTMPAQLPAATPPPAVERGGAGRFGLMLEAGVPEGGAVSVTYCPVSAVRLWAGPAWNYVGFGGQAGLMLVPFSSIIAPSLSVEVGRYLDADLRKYVDSGSGAPSEVTPLLAHVRYEYLAAHVGLELGSRRFAFTLRAGLAWIRASAQGTTRTTDASGNTTSEVYFSDPRITAAVPSVKLGIQTTF
jgi:hypothetical protein